jgi:hypothetical protein
MQGGFGLLDKVTIYSICHDTTGNKQQAAVLIKKQIQKKRPWLVSLMMVILMVWLYKCLS